MPTLQSSSRHPWPQYVAFVCFIAAAACMPFAFRSRPAPKAWTLPELAERIRQEHPELHIIPYSRGSSNLNAGFYISTNAKMWEDARRLTGTHISKWENIVICTPTGPSVAITDEQVSIWGTRILRAGDVVVFGDPELIRLIAPLIRPC